MITEHPLITKFYTCTPTRELRRAALELALELLEMLTTETYEADPEPIDALCARVRESLNTNVASIGPDVVLSELLLKVNAECFSARSEMKSIPPGSDSWNRLHRHSKILRAAAVCATGESARALNTVDSLFRATVSECFEDEDREEALTNYNSLVGDQFAGFKEMR